MSELVWPACDGETAQLIRRRNWSATPLGPLHAWPSTLRILTETILRSPVGMALIWGEEHTLLYNDAYALIAGDKHPQVLGMSVLDAWPEARDFNQSVLDAAYAGEVSVFRDRHFILDRNGAPEDIWFDLYYAPAVDEHGRVRGMLATVIETTARVQGERERERQGRHLEQVNSSLDAMRLQLERTNDKLVGDMAFLIPCFAKRPASWP